VSLRVYTLRERNARSRSARGGEKGRKRCRGMTVTLIERLHTHVPWNLGNSFHCLTPTLPVTIRYQNDSVLRNLRVISRAPTMQSMLPMGSHRITRSDYVNSLPAGHQRFNFRVVALAVFASSSPKRIEICARRHTSLNDWMLTGLKSSDRVAYERPCNGVKIRIRANGWRLAWN